MIRRAEPDDIRTLSELWARAFPGERTIEQRVRHLETGGVFGGVETAWLAERDGRPVGAFRAYALTQHLHGSTWPMMGLAAVAVDETARRRGIGRALCDHAICVARERGDTLSMLYPFRPAFYQALGWGMCGELHQYRFRPESLITAGRAADVRRAGPGDAAAIAACYDRVARESNGLIARTPRIWRSHLESEGVHTYVTGHDSVHGYIIVRFGRSAAPDEKPLYIREIIAQDQDAYDTLLAWVAAQQDAWRIIHYDACRDERFDHRLSEPRTPGFHPTRYLWAPVARIIRGPMLRILDVRAAIDRRARWGPAAPLRFGLHVLDALVPANEGPFTVDFDGSTARATTGTALPLLRMTADAFARIYAGEVTVTEALRLGLAEAEGDAAAIDPLFRVDLGFRVGEEF